MKNSVYVFDLTEKDRLSKVRGVGRYLQVLKENLTQNTIFTNNVAMKQWNNEAIFINPFFNFLQYPLTLQRVAKKQVAVIHDLIPLKYPEHFPVGVKGKLNIFLNKLALRNYDLVVTDSEASKRDIIKLLGVGENRIKVICPCLPKIFTASPVIPSEARNLATERSVNEKKYASLDFSVASLPRNDTGDNYCLYVGDATWNKNLVNLAKAIKIINVTCVFVGKVFDKKYQISNIKNQSNILKSKNNNITMKQYNNETIKNNLFNHPWGREFIHFLKEVKDDKRFIFLGYVPDEQLIQLYRGARCNILVSRDEGFGFSYLEAASQTCPSILSDIQVLHETSKNQGALFTNPNSPNDIANTIGEVYFNKDLKNKLGKAAWQRSKFFSTKKLINDFNNILNFEN